MGLRTGRLFGQFGLAMPLLMSNRQPTVAALGTSLVNREIFSIQPEACPAFKGSVSSAQSRMKIASCSVEIVV